jgi:ABC-2 type transport system permease protein
VIATLRSEWIKLRTVRVNLVLVVVALAFPVVVTVLVAVFGDDPETVRSDELADLVGGLAVVPAMLLGTIAALGLTSEYGFGTIRPTFAATPSRLRVVAAKLVVGAVAAAIVALAIVTVCWTVGAAILAGRDGSVSLSLDDGSVGALAGVVVLSVELTFFAFGVAAIVRNSPAAVTLLLLWPLVAEGIIAVLLSAVGGEDLTRWLPYSAAISTVVADPTSDVLGRPGGWIWFGVVSAVLVAVGVALVQRRDA